MAVSPLLGAARPQIFDDKGEPNAAGYIEFYVAGTSTLLDTYTDSTGATANANPVILNAAGKPPYQIHGTDGTAYKAIIKDASGAVLDTQDSIYPAISTAAAATTQTLFFNNITAKTANYTVVAGDEGYLVDCTANTFTVTLLPVATATAGFTLGVRNSGNGIITVDGYLAETVNGAATLALQPGEWVILTTDGATWEGCHYIKGLPFADGAGTVDAITADFTPNVTLTDGIVVLVKAVGQITSTAPTLAVDGLTAKTIVKEAGSSLALTDITSVNQTLLLQYDLTLDQFILLNPSVGAFRGCLVYNSVSQSIPDSSATAVTFDTESFDTDTIHDTVSNTSRLTVPTGVTKVRLTAQVFWATNATGTRRASIYKGGVATYVGNPIDLVNAGTSTSTIQQVVSPPLTVVAGNYFELYVTQTSGGALNINATTDGCWFSMEILE